MNRLATSRSTESAQTAIHAVDKSPLRQRFYYPELDAVRVFLFIGVWSYHALPRDEGYYTAQHIPAFLAWFISGIIRAGMCSLDVFFILSAFLITELLLREKDARGTPDLKMFYIRRLLRIWPLYFFVIALAGCLSLFDRTQSLSLSYATAFLLFAGNWITVLNGYPAASMIGPLWSVSFEEQFYLLWPLALRKARKTTVYGIVGMLFATATSVRLALLLKHVTFGSLWYNTFVRLDSIACGILLALILHGRPIPQMGRRLRLALLIFALFLWLIVGRYCGLHDPVPPLTGGLVGFPLMSLSASVFFLSVLGAAQDGLSFLKNPALVYLGKISYGLYAFHILAIRCAYYLFRNYHHPLRMTLSLVVALGITFVMAAASFRWLESPFLRLKQKRFTYVSSGCLLETRKTESRRDCSPVTESASRAEAAPGSGALRAPQSLVSSSIEP